MRSDDNKEQMRRDGAIPVLFKALASPLRDARYHACSALSELAFRNELNCMAIAQSEDGLEAIVDILDGEDVALKEDAMLVVNNCAAFCEDVCTAIVSCPGMLVALKSLVHTSAVGASSVAVGTVNCLSRCKEVQQVLLHAGFLETLLPVIKDVAISDKHEAHVARATMAIANLTEGACEGVFEKAEDRKAALATTVKILSHSIKGENWAGIHFAPYSVVYPLSNLANSSENTDVLMECGLAEQLTGLIREWKDVGHHSEKTLELAMQITENLCETQQSQRSLRSAGLMPVVEDVLLGTCCQKARAPVLAQAARILDKLTSGYVAFYMGHHERLGKDSPLAQLDGLVMGKIAQLAFGCSDISPLAPLARAGASKQQADPAPSAADCQRQMMLNAALARLESGGRADGRGSSRDGVGGLRRIASGIVPAQ